MSKLAAEYQAINLGQGFPDYECDEKLRNLVKRNLDEGKNQYAPLAGLPNLLETLAAKIRRSYDLEVDPIKQLCVTAGATQALFTAISAFVKSGDEVIVIEPAYDCYLPQIEIAGGIPKPYTLRYPDYTIDWNMMEELITDKTRMIIINTPHNPTGTILRERDMQALESLVASKNIIVLSDEVYEHLIFDSEEHQSVMRFPELFQQSMAVFSFGKTLHATGWKLGYIVGPEHLMDEFKRVHQWNVFCANSFLQFAIADYLKDPTTYETLPTFFEQKRDSMTKALSNIPLTPRVSEGTYFQLYSYEEVSEQSDIDFAKHMTTDIGVAGIPLSPFYSEPPDDRVIRLCFAKQQTTLEAAAERLAKLGRS